MTTKGRFAAGLLLLSTIGLCQATPASALVLSWSPDSVATDFASETATSCTLWIHPSQSGETLLTGEWRLAWSEKTEAHATRLLAVVCAPGVSEACSLASPSDGVSILAHHRIAIVDPSQTASAPLLGCIFAIAADTRAHFRLVQSGKAAAEATIRGGDAVHSPPVIFKALFDPSNVGGALAIHGDFAAQALRAAVVDSAGNVVSACSLGSTIEQWVSLPLMVPGPGFMLRLSDATGAFDLCAITFGDGPTPPAAVNTVVIGFTASTIEAPLNTGQVEIEQFTFNEPSLGDALQNCGVTHLERLVPDFSSTRSTNLIGEPILLEDLSATYIATLEPGASDSAAYNLLKDQPGIYFVHLNRSGQMSQATVNDPLFDTQWALRNVGQSICGADILSGFDLDLVEAWDITFGAAAETVAVVDTGLDTTHEEFSGGHYGLRPGTTSDVDPDRHGTLVAGVIAARANNGVGGTGVAPGCIPLAVGIGLTSNPAVLTEGIVWTTTTRRPIVNVSQGMHLGYFQPQPPSQPPYPLLNSMNLAVTNAFYTGQMVVAASGNTGDQTKHYPAAFEHKVVAVGGVGPDGNRWSEGLGIGSVLGTWIDFVGPANYVVGPRAGAAGYYDLTSCAPPESWTSGTSFAAPTVAGVAALLRSVEPRLLGEDIVEILARSARGIAPQCLEPCTGYGLVQARSALDVLNPSSNAFVQARVGGDALEAIDMFRALRTFVDLPTMPGTVQESTTVYRLQGLASYAEGFTAVPAVWTRSSGTLGIEDSTTYDYLYEVRRGRVVPGTVTTSSCVLETFIYHIDGYGWFPVPLDEAQIAFSVLGPSSKVGVSNPGIGLLGSRVHPVPSSGTVVVRVFGHPGGPARSEIYDVRGRRVRILEQDSAPPGELVQRWDGRDTSGRPCPPGIYFHRYFAAGKSLSDKIVLTQHVER